MDYEKVKKEIAEYITSLVSQGKFHSLDAPQQSRNYSAEVVTLCQAIAFLEECENKAAMRPAAPKE